MVQTDFISFFDAMDLLTETLGERPSDEQYYMWCYWGKDSGGIDAYASDGTEKIKVPCGGITFPTHRNEFGHLEYRLADLTRYLKHWQFLSNEIDGFRPEHHYVTGQQLLRRWTAMLGEFEAEHRIKDYALRFGCKQNQGERPYLQNMLVCLESENWSPIEQGIFLLEDINAIESYDHMKPNSSAESEQIIEAIGIENGNTRCFSKDETLSNAQVKKIFHRLTDEQWRGAFQRDLKSFNAGIPGKPEYKISDIENWLKKKGHYTEAEIQLAKSCYSEVRFETKNGNQKSSKNNSLGHYLATNLKQK